MRSIIVALIAVFAASTGKGQEKPPLQPPCEPYPECVLISSELVPAAPNSGIRTQQKRLDLQADKDGVLQGISPLDRSTFRVPSPSGNLLK